MDVTINNNDGYVNISGGKEPENMTDNQKRLLFVDDDPDILDGYKYIFEGEGFAVDLATNSGKMLELIMENKYDMIILDYYLDGEKGVETSKKIHRIEPKIELVFLSGQSYAWEELKAKNIPVTAFFVKPLKAEVLLDSVSEILLGIE